MCFYRYICVLISTSCFSRVACPGAGTPFGICGRGLDSYLLTPTQRLPRKCRPSPVPHLHQSIKMSTKQQYNTGVRCGNWFEDLKGADLAKHSMAARPRMEVSETSTQYRNRFDQRSESAPALAGVDAIPGRLVFAHGPNIIDERLPPGLYTHNTELLIAVGNQFANWVTTCRSLHVNKCCRLHARFQATRCSRCQSHFRR